MGLPQSPTTITSSSTHMYSQALQVKLYQAFIFSIPILFSIILFLLFYLFYLKRRSSLPLPLPLPPPPPVLPRTFSYASPFISSPCEMGLKAELKENLPKVVFDENLRERDSLCCVCLGEFEVKEELVQMPSCKHLFHVECIHLWLQSNTTCPLCRCSVVAVDHHHTKLLIASHHHHHHHQINNNHQHHQQQQVVSSVASTVQVEEAPSTSNITSRVVSHENEMDHQPPFALHIHVQNS